MKLPSFLFKKVKEHKTSLGNNEAFPPEEDFPFDYKILKTRFEEVINKINEYEDIESLEENYLISLLNKLITQCKEKENPIKEHIEKLCEKIVSETFRIPNETINLNIKLTDKLSPSKQFNLTPPTSKERTFDFDDLNDFKDSEKVILKRRLINSLIQGASYEYSTKSVHHLDEISSLLSDLKPLYERIIVINDFLLFTKKESITDDKIHQGAIVEVLLGRGDEKTEINVQGIIFPFLLNETFRGMFELFAAHGLPQDIDKANYILQQADFLLAEPWDLRMGVTLWNILSENVYGYESMPYFFMTLCEMNTDEFNLNLKEVFAQTKKGKQFIFDLNEYALKEAEYDSEIEPLNVGDENNELITDAYISSDGLDYYHLTDDELNNNVIEEEKLLKEGLYDDFDVRDADIIYYNHYQEDWGDEEEPDIQDLYDILIYDMDGNIIYENDGLLIYELDDILGEDISYMIYNNESEPNTDSFLSKNYPYRLNYINSHEFGDVNETARQLFKNQLTEYYPKLHGYIMQDGTCIDLGDDDHNTITKIPQINDKWEFVELGNIRCLKDSFDLIQEPTREQKYALRKLIANSNDLTIDIYSKDSDYVLTSARYIGNLNPSYILGQIDRFFDEGINLQGGYSDEDYDDFYMYESIEYLTESELDDMKPQEKQEINYEDLILSCSEGDIDFREEPYNLFTVSGGKQRGMWTLHVIINGIEIPTELIFLRAEEYPKLQSYQLHMEITKNLRQKGVGFKLYQAFIRIFGTTCDLFVNNSSTFYKDNNAFIDSDVSVDKLWNKLVKLPNVKVSYIVNKLKQKVGIKIDKI